jgi:hypothetical protein
MKARDIQAILKRVPELPDEAIIPDPAAAILVGMSESSLRRTNPVPKIKTGPRTGGRNLGDIRALTRRSRSAAAA